MELDLKELAATLAIGAFFLFGIEFIFQNFFGRSPSTNIFYSFEDVRKHVISAVVVTLCFTFGMVIEDVSNKFVDEDGWLSKRLGLIESDEDIKYRIFFGETIHRVSHTGEFIEELKARDFVQKSAQNNLLGQVADRNGKEFEDYLKKLRDDESNTTFANYLDQLYKTPSGSRFSNETAEAHMKNAVKKFYYAAKSADYRTTPYYDELKKIQLRIDFSRSMVGVAGFLLVLILFVLLGKVVFTILIFITKFKRLKGKIHEGLRKWRDKIFATSEFRPGILILSFLLLGSIFSLSIFAYSSEEAEFDKRIYGYYISLKTDVLEHKSIKPE